VTPIDDIDAVLLDLGGVLIDIVGAECMLEWCPSLPDTETLWNRWLASPSVRRYETGRATRSSFAASIGEEFA
jgi:putative hydrolase of the HAD superfamily